MSQTMTRGVRDNDPGNIDYDGTEWEGLVETRTDPRFCQFVSPEYGIRAIVKILISYQAEGYKTVRTMIARWAPKTENNTQAYINFVTGRMGIGADTVFAIHDPHLCLPMVTAIIAQENANYTYPEATVLQGMAMAGVST